MESFMESCSREKRKKLEIANFLQSSPEQSPRFKDNIKRI